MTTLLQPGAEAPDFKLHVSPNQQLSLSELRGRRVILAWARLPEATSGQFATRRKVWAAMRFRAPYGVGPTKPLAEITLQEWSGSDDGQLTITGAL